MVPRLRHRVGIETLKRELQLKDISNISSSSSSLAVKDTWIGTDYLTVDGNCTYDYTNHNGAVGDRIPGFRTSAAFFSSLRTNLHLGVSPPSPMSTPPSMRASASSIGPPPSPLQHAMDSSNNAPEVPEAPLSSIPELKTYIAESEEDKKAALKLVADSVAQMRQTANRILMFHPLNIAVFGAFLALVGKYLYTDTSDLGLIFTTFAGLTMAAMASIRWFTGPYISAAEEVDYSLLDQADVLVTTFGDEIIGTVILGWVNGEMKAKRRKWRADVRGWAVRLRYRGKGVGLALLEEAVELAKKKGADGVGFALDHANSTRILWDIYNESFDKREESARDRLQALWEANSKPRRR